MKSEQERTLFLQARDKVLAGKENTLTAAELGLIKRVHDYLENDPELRAYEESLTSAEKWAMEQGYDLTLHLLEYELAGSVDGTLEEAHDREVRAHLASCEKCQVEVKDIMQMRQAVQRHHIARTARRREERSIRGRIEQIKRFFRSFMKAKR